MNLQEIIILVFFLFIICLLFIVYTREDYESISEEVQERIRQQTKKNTNDMLYKIFLEIQSQEVNNHKVFNDAHDSWFFWERLPNGKQKGVNITHYNLGNEPINKGGPPEYEKCVSEGGEYAGWTVNWDIAKQKEEELLEEQCENKIGGVCLSSLVDWPILEQIWNENRSQCNIIPTNWAKIKKIYEARIDKKCGNEAIFWPLADKCVCKEGKTYDINSKTCSCKKPLKYNSEYGCICYGNSVPDKDLPNSSDIKCNPPDGKSKLNAAYFYPDDWDSPTVNYESWWPFDIPSITNDADITPRIRTERFGGKESRHKIAYNELDVLNHYLPDNDVIKKIDETLYTNINSEYLSYLTYHPREYLEDLQTKKIIPDNKKDRFFALKKLYIHLKKFYREPFIGPWREGNKKRIPAYAY